MTTSPPPAGGTTEERVPEHGDTLGSSTGIGATGTRTVAGRRTRGPVRLSRLDVLWSVFLILLAFTVSTLAVVRAISLSPFDEASHFDYAWSISHGNLPFAGSQMAPEVLHEWSCRSQEGIQYILPKCGEEHPAGDYPLRGENYNYFHPPTYYAATGAMARVLDALPVGVTFLTAARLTGGIWLAAALVGLYLVLRQWGISRVVAVSGTVILAAVPSVAHASSIVTNDAPGVLMGVLALWVLTRVAAQGRLGWLLPTALAAVVASTKVMHSVAMLAVAGILLLAAVAAFRAGDRVRARALGIISAGIVGATGIVYVGWSAFQSTRGNPGWTNPVEGINTEPVVGTPFGEWLPTLFSTFGIAQTFWLQAALTSVLIIASARWLTLLFTVAPFANVSAFRVGDPRRLVGWASLLGCAAVPVLVQMQAYLMFHDYFPFVSSRYGISLLPLTIAAIALVAEARTWKVAAALVSFGSIAALLAGFSGLY